VSVLTTERAGLRSALPQDHEAISALLAEPLSFLYPGGQEWLSRRLATLAETGRATVVASGATVIAVAIETWKPAGRVKLSTFFVCPESRQSGVGALLAANLVQRWNAERRPEAYVTVSESAVEALSRVLVPLGFAHLAMESNRYGVGRHEHVLTWLGQSGSSSPPSDIPRRRNSSWPR
jgi:hypothetical protein